jgi:hypothetical protein
LLYGTKHAGYNWQPNHYADYAQPQRWRIEDLLKMMADEGVETNLVPWGQGYKDMGRARLPKTSLMTAWTAWWRCVWRWDCVNGSHRRFIPFA